MPASFGFDAVYFYESALTPEVGHRKYLGRNGIESLPAAAPQFARPESPTKVQNSTYRSTILLLENHQI